MHIFLFVFVNLWAVSAPQCPTGVSTPPSGILQTESWLEGDVCVCGSVGVLVCQGLEGGHTHTLCTLHYLSPLIHVSAMCPFHCDISEVEKKSKKNNVMETETFSTAQKSWKKRDWRSKGLDYHLQFLHTTCLCNQVFVLRVSKRRQTKAYRCGLCSMNSSYCAGEIYYVG